MNENTVRRRIKVMEDHSFWTSVFRFDIDSEQFNSELSRQNEITAISEDEFVPEGFVAWERTKNDKLRVVFGKRKGLPIDSSTSRKPIHLQIAMYPNDLCQTAPIPQKQINYTQGTNRFFTRLVNYTKRWGCAIRELSVPRNMPALAEKLEEKETFDCFITAVYDDVACVTLVDDDSKKSYMEIPIEDLEKSNVESKPGTLFSFTLKQRGGWEKVEISSIEKTPMTKEERDKLLNDFEKKYGEV